jgi:hypothetical protein
MAATLEAGSVLRRESFLRAAALLVVLLHAAPVLAQPAPEGARPAPATSQAAPATAAPVAAPEQALPAADPNAPKFVLIDGKRRWVPREAEQGRPVAWMTGGGAVAAFGGGLAVALMAKSTSTSLSTADHTASEIDVLNSKYTSQAQVANVLFVAALGLAVASAACIYFKY